MTNTVCYKLREPVYYNKGTKYEKTCDTFLAYYCYKTDAEVDAEVAKLNAEKPEILPVTEERIDWNKIEYFFRNKQEEMY